MAPPPPAPQHASGQVVSLEDPADPISRPLSMPGAYLLTTDPEGNQIAVPNLTLTVDKLGMKVARQDGRLAAQFTWKELSHMEGVDTVDAPDGRPALLLEIASKERMHRFIVPSAGPEELTSMIIPFANLCTAKSRNSKRGTTTGKFKHPVSTAILAILLLAVVVVLLLMSMQVIHF